jgi:dolichol-phosphate mannosyltransferase
MPSSDSKSGKPSVSLFFPVYNDGHVIEELVREADAILAELTCRYEIIAINDASKDNSGEIADRLAQEIPHFRVIHHPTNRGYGAALSTGFQQTGSLDWICFTDGDHQYDISELRRFMKHLDRYDVIIGNRVAKSYGPLRKFLSFGMNSLVRLLFGTPFRDVTCGFKMIRSDAARDVKIISRIAFAGGEVAVRAFFEGYRVGQVAVSMYPRQYGTSAAVNWRGIWVTAQDLFAVHRDLMRNKPRPPRTYK